MNFRHLRTFVLIAESGGISHASARLHLSLPAASRQILALENEFQVKLFDRIGRRLKLTPEGEDLLVRCRRLLNDAESLGARARTLKEGHTGLLRVAAAPQAIEALFAPFIQQYRRRHGGVDIHLVEDASGNLAARLERGDVHVAEVPAGDQRFLTRLMFPIHALVVLPRTHRLARRATLDIAELADEPMALTRREFRLRGSIDAAFDIAHVQPNIVLESAAPHTLVAVAATGYATAIVPSNVPIADKGVRAIPLVVRGGSIGTWAAVAWHPQRYLPPYAERFVEEFAAYARRADPGREIVRRAPPLPRPRETAELRASATASRR
jgi:LysR family cyn operon transcriptional activator